jgi:hypothetical protein
MHLSSGEDFSGQEKERFFLAPEALAAVTTLTIRCTA